MGNFFRAIGHFFASHFGQAPSVLQKASSILGYIAPLLKLIFSQVDPGDVPVVSNTIAEVQASMATAAALISESHNATDATTKARVSSALNAVANHLTDLLAAGHVKNESIKASVAAGVEELQQVVRQLSA